MSVPARVAGVLLLTAVAALGLHALLTRGALRQALELLFGAEAGAMVPSADGLAGVALTVLLLTPVLLAVAAALTRPLRDLLRSLEAIVLSYQDGDFNRSLARQGQGELDALVVLHNRLGQALRDQRQHLVERELLLDTVVQNTPVAMILTDGTGRVAYANIAARQLLGEGRSLERTVFADLLGEGSSPLHEAVAAGADSVFTLPGAAGDETFHYSRRRFRLKGLPHELHLLRRMTRELSRQEVMTWKRVIRVMSHELNNSLAPISSLAHTGAELARRGEVDRLPAVFGSIGERARHLQQFLDGYASVAKLPAPRRTAVNWRALVDDLGAQHAFRLDSPLPSRPGHFDLMQVEQALINLLKNATEAGGAPEDVVLSIRVDALGQCISVEDRGQGMADRVLAQALLPFYSTKRGGGGVGLSLCREIAEAHGGQLSLDNRPGGGIRASLRLPWATAGQSACHASRVSH